MEVRGVWKGRFIGQSASYTRTRTAVMALGSGFGSPGGGQVDLISRAAGSQLLKRNIPAFRRRWNRFDRMVGCQRWTFAEGDTDHSCKH